MSHKDTMVFGTLNILEKWFYYILLGENATSVLPFTFIIVYYFENSN